MDLVELLLHLNGQSRVSSGASGATSTGRVSKAAVDATPNTVESMTQIVSEYKRLLDAALEENKRLRADLEETRSHAAHSHPPSHSPPPSASSGPPQPLQPVVANDECVFSGLIPLVDVTTNDIYSFYDRMMFLKKFLMSNRALSGVGKFVAVRYIGKPAGIEFGCRHPDQDYCIYMLAEKPVDAGRLASKVFEFFHVCRRTLYAGKSCCKAYYRHGWRRCPRSLDTALVRQIYTWDELQTALHAKSMDGTSVHDMRGYSHHNRHGAYDHFPMQVRFEEVIGEKVPGGATGHVRCTCNRIHRAPSSRDLADVF